MPTRSAFLDRLIDRLDRLDPESLQTQFLRLAHERGLSVGLKNDLDQVADLVADFDWALNEQCYEYDECGVLQLFIDAGKAVFGVEYSGDEAVFCPYFNALEYSWLKKDLDLGVWRIDCHDIR